MFESDIQLYRIDDFWVFEGTSGARLAQVAAVALFVVLGSAALRRGGLAPRSVALAIAGALTSGLAGAWLVDGLLTRDFAHFGLSVAGAVVAGPLGFVLGGAAAGMSRRDALDALGRLAPVALIAAAVARVGCLFSGCDFGAPTQLPWAVRHGWDSAAWHDSVAHGLVDAWSRTSASVHPFAAYEAGLCALAAAAAATALRRGVAPPAVALGAGAAYALARAFAEMFRGGVPDGAPSVVFAVALATAGVLVLALTTMVWAPSSFRILRPICNVQEIAP